MILDCFPFFNELDILQLRLYELADVVDKFVFIEASQTHTGKSKPFYYEENKQLFEKYAHKIVSKKIDFNLPVDTWGRENLQRLIIGDVLKEVYDFLLVQSIKSKQNNIDKIIIDPGIGFGKRVEDNYALIRNLDYFQSLGYPVMIGLSKKSFIGKTLNLDSDQREIGTVILETVSVLKSARIIRTHNVKYCNQIVKLASHIL